MPLELSGVARHTPNMNLTINRYQGQYPLNPFQPACCAPPECYTPESPLGQPRPGIGSFIGGLVGSVLGQVLCPIPFVGAILGGMIGSMFGSMLDSLLQMGSGCCCHNMGQNYGPMNQSMGGCYGYPTDYPYLPQEFYNPAYGQAPPLFPTQEPPVAPGRFPELGLLPWGNDQHQRHHDHTTEKPQVAVAVAGRNRQVEENVHGHNRGSQTAVNVVGVNEQRQTNVTGNNEGRQVAVVSVGANQQTQENVAGDNKGTQVAVANLGTNTQTQSNVTGDNTGSQTAVVAAGSNTQTQKNEEGNNAGSQTAVVVAGTNTQVQENVIGANSGDQSATAVVGANTQTQANNQGDNTGTQSAGTLVGPNTQTQTTATGDNTGSQASGSLVGDNSQRQETLTGDNSGNQAASTFVGDNTQVKATENGRNTGDQTASTTFGNNTQVNVADQTVVTSQQAETARGDNTQVVAGGDQSVVDQTATTNHGDNTQTTVVGDQAVVHQEAATGDGHNDQTVVAGQNAVVVQTANGNGNSSQNAVVTSGTVVQTGANNQNATSAGGPVVVQQQGDRYQDNQQNVNGSNAGDVIEQRAGQGALGLGLFDNNTTASVNLGGGNDTYTYEGNSEANHVRVNGGGAQAGPDRDVVRIDTKGGDDTAVVNLSSGRDNYRVDMGSGNDRLVINEKGQRVRVVDSQGREVYRSNGWTEQDGTATVDGMENLQVYREDGSFARWDRRHGLQEGRDSGRPGEMTPVGAARLLREYAGDLDKAANNGSVDGIIGRSDLTAALNNPETPDDLRRAIRYTLDNDAVWKAMDASGAGSNRVDLRGLNSFIDGYETRPGYDANAPMTDRQAVSVLNYHSAVLDTAHGGGSSDSKFNEDDLRAIASGNNPGLPPELRAAAQRLLGSSSLQRRVDDVSWEAGGIFDSQRTFSNSDLAGFRG